MSLIYIVTPESGKNESSLKQIRGYCNYLRYDGVPLCPQLVFGYMDESDRTGWFRERRGEELLECCDSVYVFADEVTELMIKEIRWAQAQKKPVHFHDAAGKKIDYDALIINGRVGPGYRKIIAEANGEKCCSGICPYGSEVCTKTEPGVDAGDHHANSYPSAATGKPKAPTTSGKKRGLLSRLFGRE